MRKTVLCCFFVLCVNKKSTQMQMVKIAHLLVLWDVFSVFGVDVGLFFF